MQDRFKFRFWDKKENRFLPNFVELNNIKIFTIIDNTGVYYVKQLDNDETFFIDKTNDVEIMQCTGLKDKNSRLIYEGDIVKLKNPYVKKQVLLIPVLWESAPILTGFNFGEEFANDVEVIGNIYENPELLEGKND